MLIGNKLPLLYFLFSIRSLFDTGMNKKQPEIAIRTPQGEGVESLSLVLFFASLLQFFLSQTIYKKTRLRWKLTQTFAPMWVSPSASC